MVVLTEVEISIILDDLLEVYGYDFFGYAATTMQRRIARLFRLRTFFGFDDFRVQLRSSPDFLSWFIAEVTVPVTEMFRDPEFFKALRETVLPQLSHLPHIRIWHAGCATGEEVYAMAILLQETGLLNRSLLYATDINPAVLTTAAAGKFPLQAMEKYSENYLQAGGKQALSTYYRNKKDMVKMDEQFGARMVFSSHNLASDASFNHFQLIICRNVLIYFNPGLQNQVVNLFDASLQKHGFLALGSKETLRFTSLNSSYQKFNLKEKIWQKT